MLLEPGDSDQIPKAVPKFGPMVITGEYPFSLMGCASSPHLEGTGKH